MVNANDTTDLVIDARNINASLDLMDANPGFVWQHESVLFLRAYVEMYGPQAEAALVARMKEGRFDIGGTFMQGLESTMVNEVGGPLGMHGGGCAACLVGAC